MKKKKFKKKNDYLNIKVNIYKIQRNAIIV